jgi:endonuclease/exonuclease/phosphatase family metal-dependent hydrolase
MRIATWNLLHGQPILPTSGPSLEPLNEEANLERIADFITASKIDVIGLQEVDAEQPRSGHHSQVARIAERMGIASSKGVDDANNSYYAFARTVIGTPGFKWRSLRKAEKIINPDDKEPSYGIGLISRVPVLEWHTLHLGRSLVGLPLAVPGGKNGKSIRLLYVKDEPRIALAAELENGYTVAVTHLSFVPLVNLWQLFRLKRWLLSIASDKNRIILIGDLNLPFNIPVRPKFLTRWASLNDQKSYPSWKPAVKFDYILTKKSSAGTTFMAQPVVVEQSGFSDHLPIVADMNVDAEFSI